MDHVGEGRGKKPTGIQVDPLFVCQYLTPFLKFTSGERTEAGAAEAVEEPEEERDYGEAEEAPGADGERAARFRSSRPRRRLRSKTARPAHAGQCTHTHTLFIYPQISQQ